MKMSAFLVVYVGRASGTPRKRRYVSVVFVAVNVVSDTLADSGTEIVGISVLVPGLLGGVAGKNWRALRVAAPGSEVKSSRADWICP